MIRINLLAIERKPAPQGLDLSQKITIGCSVLLLTTVALLGWRFWSLRQESARLDADLAAAQQESQRLQGVVAQIAEFEKRRAQLQQRVALIEELRRGQGGPVHMLDEVSRAVPDRLWLTQMAQQGNELRIEGRTTTLTALSDFVGNLEASGYFARPVEIVDSQVESTPAQQQQQGGAPPDVVRFTVKAQFALPGSTPQPAPDAVRASTVSARPAAASR